MRSAAPMLALALCGSAGCVNNYVLVESSTESDGDGGEGPGDTDGVGDGCGDAEDCTTTAIEDGSATGEGTSSSSSSPDSTSGATADGDPSSVGDPSDGGSGTIGDELLGQCEICEVDAQCAGDAAFCVPVDETLRCLQPCSEQEPPCAAGFTCETVQTSDGTMVDLCVPVGADCPTAGEG